MERTSTATAPTLAAETAPPLRWFTAPPYAANVLVRVGSMGRL